MNPEPRDLNLFHCQERFEFGSVSNSVKVEYLSAKIITMKKIYSCYNYCKQIHSKLSA